MPQVVSPSQAGRSVLLFGDDQGIQILLEALPRERVCGMVGAAIRPHQHENLRRIAADCRLPLWIQPPAASTEYLPFIEQIRSLSPDLILVNSYSMLLRREILSVPRHGAVNIHPALLPEYRGCNPLQWPIINAERQTGVTMHYMTPDFDAGDIIAQREVPIHFEDTWLDVHARIVAAIVRMLTAEIPALLQGSNGRRPQDESRARYLRRRTPSDGLIDWDWSVLQIYNLIRALVKPLPGAFCASPAGTVLLNEYLTIPEVTMLKYGELGGRRLGRDNTALVPLPPRDWAVVPLDEDARGSHALFPTHRVALSALTGEAEGNSNHPGRVRKRNSRVVFAIHTSGSPSARGTCELDSIYWDRGTAEMRIFRVKPAPDHHGCLAADAARILLHYAFDELGLQRIRVNPAGNTPEMNGIYKELGFEPREPFGAEASAVEEGTGGTAMTISRDGHAWEEES